MNDEKLLKLINNIEIIVVSKFDEFERGTHAKDAEWNYDMVYFATEGGKTRKISDWGRDEDTDYYIGIDKNGWCRYTTVLQCGAGPTSMTSAATSKLTPRQVFNVLNNLDLEGWLEFIAKCHDVFEKYKYGIEFRDLLRS